MKKLNKILLSVLVAILAIIGISAPVTSYADFSGSQSQICTGIGTVNGSGGCDNSGSQSTIDKIIAWVVNILTVIVGITAVIMIIVAGFRFVTSGGDSANVAGAKNTIIYAIVGLIVVALAQVIVHFVLTNIK